VPHGVFENCRKHPERSGGDTFTTRYLASTLRRKATIEQNLLGSRSDRNLGLHFLKIVTEQASHRSFSEQRLYVRLDPASVHGKGARLYQATFTPSESPDSCLLQVPVANFSNRNRGLAIAPYGPHRIFAARRCS
jgi:hypothetical protein